MRPRASVLVNGVRIDPAAGDDRRAILKQLNALFGEVVRRHGGRVVGPFGDGFIVEFKESVAAVSCALDTLTAVEEWNEKNAETPYLKVRLGVHHGDVERTGDDLTGPGLNVAKDLEHMAPDGTVAVSQVVLDQVKFKVNATGGDVGAHDFDSLLAAIHAYVLRPADHRLDRVADSLLMEFDQGGGKAPSQWLRIVPVVAVIAIAIAVIASVTWPEKEEMPKEAAAPVVVEKIRGGVLAVGWQGSLGRFTLYGGADSLARTALDLVLEPFMRVNDSGVVEPWVVASWGESASGKKVTLTLRSRVTFHPNPCLQGGAGRLAVADDLVYSIELATSQGVLPPGTKANQDDGGSVVVEYVHAGKSGVRDLADVVLVPRELGACEDPTNLRQPVGTGPFRFPSAQRGQKLELERAISWWREADDGQSLPYLDGVRLEGISDVETARTALASGKLNLVRLRPGAGSEGRKLTAAPDVEGRVVLVVSLTDANHRKAIGLAVNRGPLVKRSPYPLEPTPALWKGQPVELDAASARQLAQGLEMLRVGVSASTADIGAAVAAQLAEALGIGSVQLVRLPALDRVDLEVVQVVGRRSGDEPYDWLLELAADVPGIQGEVRRLSDSIRAAEGDRTDRFIRLEDALTRRGHVVPIGRWPAGHTLHELLLPPSVGDLPAPMALRPGGAPVGIFSELYHPAPQTR